MTSSKLFAVEQCDAAYGSSVQHERAVCSMIEQYAEIPVANAITDFEQMSNPI